MANRLKSKKGQVSGSAKLKPEKETRVTARQIAKDERTHKITGAVFLLLAIFLLLAFTSYLIHLEGRSEHRLSRVAYPHAISGCEGVESVGESGRAGFEFFLF